MNARLLSRRPPPFDCPASLQLSQAFLSSHIRFKRGRNLHRHLLTLPASAQTQERQKSPTLASPPSLRRRFHSGSHLPPDSFLFAHRFPGIRHFPVQDASPLTSPGSTPPNHPPTFTSALTITSPSSTSPQPPPVLQPPPGHFSHPEKPTPSPTHSSNLINTVPTFPDRDPFNSNAPPPPREPPSPP